VPTNLISSVSKMKHAKQELELKVKGETVRQNDTRAASSKIAPLRAAP
jgi:hypothetical protein